MGNVNDYIKRKDALSRFTFFQGDLIPEKDVDGFENTISFRDAKRVIREVPSADARTVVHAHWEGEAEICSACGERSTEGFDAEIWAHWCPDFCPHCGAQMDGGDVDV